MDGPRLHGILIENFRSIDRKVEVRLDAPVVLVQGQNRAGKTSLLSAVELALTGAVPSMERADRRYMEQLLHQGATHGRIVLNLEAVDDVTGPLEVELTPSGVARTGSLGARHSKFFSERCYLAQSSLTQLLTIYQEANADVDSLLSRFVSELLGLDRLDALELGLAPARDLRNARRMAPSYLDVEQEIALLKRKLQEAAAQLREVNGALELSRSSLQAALTSLEMKMPTSDEARSVLERQLGSENEEPALIDLADRSRQLIALRREHARQAQISATNPSAVALVFRSAQQELAAWRNQHLAEITQTLAGIRPFFPNAELDADIAPGQALADAIALSTAEIKRLEDAEARLSAGTRRLVELDDALKRNESRTSELDKEIALIAVETGPFSTILSELIAHIHGEECPVCGRDYSEVSEEPLASHVAKKSVELSDQAERFRALTAERNSLTNQSVALTRERAEIESQSLLDRPLLDVQDRLAKLRNSLPALRALQPAGFEGDRLTGAELAVRPTSPSARIIAGEERSLRSALAEQAAYLGVPTAPGERLEGIFDRVDASLKQTERTLNTRREARKTAIEQLSQFNFHNGHAVALRREIQRHEEDQARVTRAFDAAERIRSDARQILVAASATRAMVVGKVFNERLNSLWRDLFVRLARSEAFVPFFEVPTNPPQRLVPSLKTRHRSGATGGTPAAMLSAGNLNTAALTLFLALHLSIPTQLPWLILDDPVQSMDEVHIAQFAALLRTLSKEHRRQIIIAVHDRPLFDYLSLELSPAFAGDELITIELAKSADDHSRYITNRRSFEPDTAVKPIAA
jgi:DNA repair protein SbcC/Rad50